MQRREAGEHREAHAQAGARRAHPLAEAQPGGVHLRDVVGQRRPPHRSLRRAAVRRRAQGGGARVDEQRGRATLEHRQQRRDPRDRARARQDAGRQAQAHEPGVEPRRQVRRRRARRGRPPPTPAGRPAARRRRRCTRRAGVRPRRRAAPRCPGGRRARPARGRASSPAQQGGPAHRVVVGGVDRPLRLAVQSQHPSVARAPQERSGGAAGERRQQGLGPQVLVHVDARAHAGSLTPRGRAGMPPTRARGGDVLEHDRARAHDGRRPRWRSAG